ncbi:MAG: TolC family protein, partial [Chloroflexi bacterium]|nr:TolC family protein [Chloroflexota bacterium]
MKTLTTALLLSLLLASPGLALTLDEAVQAALQNHQRIEQFRANAAQSQATVGSAKAAFLPRVDLGYTYRERADDPYLLGDKSSTLFLGASINLFNGLSDYRTYQAARQRALGADHRLQGTIADIILATRQAYIEGLRSRRSVATAEEGVKLLEQQKRDTELQYEYGLLARNDLLRVEVELSSARQDLLRAQGQQQIARRQLERNTGILLAADESLVEPGLNQLLSSDPQQTDNYRLEMLEKRSELNYLRTELQAAKLEISASKGGYLPKLDLSVSHEEYSDDLSPAGSDDQDNLLTLRADWNLFDGFAKNKRVAAADARSRAVAAELRDTEAALALQLETALQNARIAQGRLQEAGSGVIQAEENYRVTENLFKQQQATSVDLLDAQFLLTRARNLAVNARYDLFLNSALLERILERQ